MSIAGLYKHYKGGWYLVLGMATDSTNRHPGPAMVVYISLKNLSLHVRNLHEFMSTVWHNGEVIQRFRRVFPRMPARR